MTWSPSPTSRFLPCLSRRSRWLSWVLAAVPSRRIALGKLRSTDPANKQIPRQASKEQVGGRHRRSRGWKRYRRLSPAVQVSRRSCHVPRTGHSARAQQPSAEGSLCLQLPFVSCLLFSQLTPGATSLRTHTSTTPSRSSCSRARCRNDLPAHRRLVERSSPHQATTRPRQLRAVYQCMR